MNRHQIFRPTSDASLRGSEQATSPHTFFVHSGFRTGSTFIWSRFRETTRAIAFNEIFHGSLIDITSSDISKYCPQTWYSKHPETAPYFAEYVPLIESRGGVKSYDRSMEIDLFIPAQGIGGSITRTEAEYVSSLINYARSLNKTPVLTMVRSLGRVAGLKAEFPGVHVLLYRGIFRQWASFSEQAWRGNHWFFDITRSQFKASRHDKFIDRLCNVFNIDDFSYTNTDSFYAFIGLQLYLYSRAVDHADILIDLTNLAVDEKYRADIEAFIYAAGLQVDFSGAKDTFALSVCPINEAELTQWVSIVCDWVCEEASPSGRAFVERAAGEIVREVKQYQLFTDGISSAFNAKVRGYEATESGLRLEIIELSKRLRELANDLNVCKFAEAQLAMELSMLQSRSPLQRLLHKNRIRGLRGQDKGQAA